MKVLVRISDKFLGEIETSLSMLAKEIVLQGEDGEEQNYILQSYTVDGMPYYIAETAMEGNV